MSAVWDRPRIRALVFWVYTCLLVIATHIPNDSLPPIDIPWFDKFEHVGAYGLWTLLLLTSGLLGNGPFGKLAGRALLLGFLLAVTDELFQMIPALNRVADPLDVVADVLGSGGAVCAVWSWRRWRKSPGHGD